MNIRVESQMNVVSTYMGPVVSAVVVYNWLGIGIELRTFCFTQLKSSVAVCHNIRNFPKKIRTPVKINPITIFRLW